MGLVNWVMDTASMRCGFTTVEGGVSQGEYSSLNLGYHVEDVEEHVRLNRQRLAEEVPGIAWMEQVHGARVVLATVGEVPIADALILAPGSARAAAVMVADCVPLLLADSQLPLGAAVHVGRAGLLAGVAPKAVEKLREMGAENLSGIIGPSICGTCYEVPEKMREEAEMRAPGSASISAWGTPAIDIPRGLRGQLGDISVDIFPYDAPCTFENPHYFSHRRATSKGHLTGRFVGIVEITHDTPA